MENDLYVVGSTVTTGGHRICRHCGDAVPSMPLYMVHVFDAGYCKQGCMDAATEARQLRALAGRTGSVNRSASRAS